MLLLDQRPSSKRAESADRVATRLLKLGKSEKKVQSTPEYAVAQPQIKPRVWAYESSVDSANVSAVRKDLLMTGLAASMRRCGAVVWRSCHVRFEPSSEGCRASHEARRVVPLVWREPAVHSIDTTCGLKHPNGGLPLSLLALFFDSHDIEPSSGG